MKNDRKSTLSSVSFLCSVPFLSVAFLCSVPFLCPVPFSLKTPVIFFGRVFLKFETRPPRYAQHLCAWPHVPEISWNSPSLQSPWKRWLNGGILHQGNGIVGECKSYFTNGKSWNRTKFKGILHDSCKKGWQPFWGGQRCFLKLGFDLPSHWPFEIYRLWLKGEPTPQIR